MEGLLNAEWMKRPTRIEERYIWGERKVMNKCTNKQGHEERKIMSHLLENPTF
jgi:hypothetical protein